MKARSSFLVGNDSNDNGLKVCASHLANLFYPESKSETKVTNLNQENCLDGLSENDLQQMVFLGHGCRTHYGKYTADEFAELLSIQFQHKQAKKHLVQDLYLIGCDMGVIDDSGRSLAQDIADRLFKKGFINARVHSVAQPEGAEGESLYVEVIEAPSLGNKLVSKQTNTHTNEGYISAYLFNKKDGDEFFELLKDKQKNLIKMDKFKKEHAFEFMRHAHPHVELNKPHNTFVPNENPEARKQRIAEHPYTKSTDERNQVIDLLTKRRDYEASKKNKTLAKKLDFIIKQINRAEPDEYKGLIKKYLPYLQSKILGIDFSKKSNTVKLLKHLGEGDFKKAEALVGKQKVKDKSSSESKSKLHIALPSAKFDVNLSKRKAKTTKLEKKERVVTQAKIEEESYASSSSQENGRNGSLKDILKHAQARLKLKIAIEAYDARIDELSAGCFSCFSYELRTKLTKRAALQDVYDQATFTAMQMTASNYMLNDSRVMLSWNTTVTADLLNLIVNNHEALLKGDKKDNLDSVNATAEDYIRNII